MALVVLVVVALSACTGRDAGSPASPSGRPTGDDPTAPAAPSPDGRGGSLRYALGADPLNIDPRFVADEAGRAVVDAVFDSLVALDRDLQVIPAAAERWEVSEDARTFTFHLADARFHDGTPVRAQDFIRAFTRIVSGTQEPTSLVAFRLERVAGFDDTRQTGVPMTGLVARDDRTLEITLEQPFAEFLQVLTDPSLAPVPLVADDESAGFAQMPVGNGPFVMAEPWQHDQFIRVSRNEEYHDEPALLDEVVFQIYSDDLTLDAQWSDLQSGQLHFAEVAATKLDQAVEEFGRSDDGYTGPGVLDGLTTTIYYFGFNTEREPFDDPAVRRAISLLIDRDRIVETIMRGTRQAATAIVPPSIPGSQPGVCDHCRFDVEEARALLADRVLEPITIRHNTGKTHAAVAGLLANELRRSLEVEVEVEVVATELQDYVDELRAGEMGIFRLGWEADHPSPASYLDPLFHSASIGTDNLTRFSDPEVDALLDEARATTDPEARTERYHDVERRVLDAVAIAPVMYYEHDRVVAPDVRGLVLSPMGTVDLTSVSLADPS